MRIMPASEDIISLFAGAPNILEFKPYTQLEHILRLVKAHARRKLSTIMGSKLSYLSQ